MPINGVSPTTFSAIESLQSMREIQRPEAKSAVAQAGQTFEQLLTALNESQAEADGYVEKLALGESVDLHDVMLNLEQNDVQFRVALAIRDKLVEAYREVMRIQV